MNGALAWAFALAALIAAGPAATTAAERGRATETYELVQVAEGIHAFIAPEPRTGVVQGNSVAIIGDDGVLVVDTGQFPGLARRMIGDIRKLTDKPVRVVVNTHWHGDHLLANGQYRESYPNVTFVAHPETRRLAAKSYAEFAPKAIKKLPEVVQRMRELLAAGKTEDGKPLSEEDRQYGQVEIQDLEDAVRGLPEIRFTPADVTFDRELSVHLGEREVKLMHIGRGNTSGDVIVYVPDAKVLMTGDLVVNPTPYSFGSFLGEWIETLRKVEAVGASTIVPGHGPLMKDTAYIDTLIELIQSVRTQVQAAVKEGLSLEDTRKKVDLDSFRKRLAGDDMWRRRAFVEFFETPAVARAYKEAKGEPMEE
jgi:glyoxylase-like metal-dependent hydrolase (beta-lactamase superfamily II)